MAHRDRRATVRVGRNTAVVASDVVSRASKLIRACATEHGIAVPARGRIPSVVEQQYKPGAHSLVTAGTHQSPTAMV
jgi:hypothetical protein